MSSMYRAKQYLRQIPFVKQALQSRNRRRLEAQNRDAGKMVKDHGLEVARDFISVLERTGYEVFCTFGMLLGLVREGHFLKNDADLDFGFLLDGDNDWAEIEEVLSLSGYTKVREFSYEGRITEQTYEARGISIDLFGYFQRDDSVISYAYRRDLDTIYPDRRSFTAYFHTAPKFSRVIDWSCDYGMLPAPENPEKYLESVYGEGWRVPSSWENGSGPNITFLDGFGFLERSK